MKLAAYLLLLALIAWAQVYFIGLNGLTLFSVPLTFFLGLKVIEKLTEDDEQTI